MRVVQLSARLEYGDAVSNHVLEMDRRLRGKGVGSSIVCDSTDRRCRSFADSVDSEAFSVSPDDILVYHHSIYSPVSAVFRRAGGTKVLVYHNITPAHFFRPYSEEIAMACEIGRRSMSGLTQVSMALGDSDYNRRELVDFGFDASRTAVLPIFVDFDRFAAAEVDERLMSQYQGQGAKLLFVGRLAPNKKFEDVIKTFFVFRRLFDPKARLFLVGNPFLEGYVGALRRYVAYLGLEDSVVFAGRVSLSELKTYYQMSDVFLSMSEHEGFCVPLVEAMMFDLPIIGYDSSAVPETLGGSGLLLTEKDHRVAAAAVSIVLEDRGVRESLLAGQRRRLDVFRPEVVEAKFWRLIESLGVDAVV